MRAISSASRAVVAAERVECSRSSLATSGPALLFVASARGVGGERLGYTGKNCIKESVTI